MADSVLSGRNASTTILENIVNTTPQPIDGAVSLADAAGYRAPELGDAHGRPSFASQQDGRR